MLIIGHTPDHCPPRDAGPARNVLMLSSMCTRRPLCSVAEIILREREEDVKRHEWRSKSLLVYPLSLR